MATGDQPVREEMPEADETAAPAETPPAKEETMEIHPIHGPVLSIREFFVHLSIITIGILIALSLEGLVEWRHNRTLVREARANITAEIRKNKGEVDRALPELQNRQDQLHLVISAMHRLEANPGKGFKGELNYSWTNYELYATAWKTAATSGAVNYMPYEELQDYTDVYDTQQDFSALQSQAFKGVADIGALIDVTMAKDVKKVPAGKFEAIEEAAYRGIFVDKALEVITRDLSKRYEELLRER